MTASPRTRLKFIRSSPLSKSKGHNAVVSILKNLNKHVNLSIPPKITIKSSGNYFFSTSCVSPNYKQLTRNLTDSKRKLLKLRYVFVKYRHFSNSTSSTLVERVSEGPGGLHFKWIKTIPALTRTAIKCMQQKYL